MSFLAEIHSEIFEFGNRAGCTLRIAGELERRTDFINSYHGRDVNPFQPPVFFIITSRPIRICSLSYITSGRAYWTSGGWTTWIERCLDLMRIAYLCQSFSWETYRSAFHVDVADSFDGLFNESRFMSEYSQHLKSAHKENSPYREIAREQNVHLTVPSNRVEIFETQTKYFERIDSFLRPVENSLGQLQMRWNIQCREIWLRVPASPGTFSTLPIYALRVPFV
jgi:hypothetical protein